MTQREFTERRYLVIGILHILYLVNEPGIAIHIWVLYGYGLTALQGEDKVFRVQHVQHRTDIVTVHLCHVTTGLCHRLRKRLHLRCDIRLYQFLITTQFGGMITADALMIIAGLILVERVRGEVQHTIVKTLVAQYQLIRLCLLLGCLTLRCRHEHLVVQITLVHLPQVNQAQHQDGPYHIVGLQFTILVKQQDTRSDDDDPERTPAVGREYCLTHFRQVAHQRLEILCRQSL